MRVGWVTALSGLVLTFAIKGIQGAIRLNAFWEDLGPNVGYWDTWFGTETLIKELGPTSEKVSYTFLRFNCIHKTLHSEIQLVVPWQ
jgi:hypothetical protein